MAATDHLRKILVVEDDADLREGILVPCLSEAGFNVAQAANTREMYRQLLLHAFDLVLLDVGLPDEDGYSALEHLSQARSCGIVMLTGRRSSKDRIRGLSAGADAYLDKPVDPDVLIATLNSVLRRVREDPLASSLPTASTSEQANTDPTMPSWRVNANSWSLIAPNGKSAGLNPSERSVISLLLASPGSVATKDMLIEHITDNIHDFDPHRLEVIIHRLRRKVLDVTSMALPLTTVRNIGYVLNIQPSVEDSAAQ